MIDFMALLFMLEKVTFKDIPEVESDKGQKSAERTPNYHRSDAFNPTSAESKVSNDNRANQMNPNNPDSIHFIECPLQSSFTDFITIY